MTKTNEVDIFEKAGEKIEKQEVKLVINPDHAMDELIGSICDPIIAWPSPWMDTIPEDLKAQVPLERMILQMQYIQGQIKEMTATEVEALIYMYPRTLEAPVGETWTQIYVFLGARVCGRIGRNVPDDMTGVVLTRHQEQLLNDLKRWIYQARVRRRKEKASNIRKEQKAQEKEEEEASQYTFDLFEEGVDK